MVAPDYVTKYKDQASHVTHQQHLQMGLRKGMAILVYYVVEFTHYQVVLLAQDSVLGRGGKKENWLWKRVTPSVTEFAWLPPAIAVFFFLAGCNRSLGYRQSRLKRRKILGTPRHKPRSKSSALSFFS